MGAGFQIPAFVTLTPVSSTGQALRQAQGRLPALSRQGRGGSGGGPEVVAGYVADELTGGLEPVAGPEAPDYAVHDVEEEADDGLAVVGARPHDARDAGIICQGWRGEGRGEVFEGLVRRGCAGACRYWGPIRARATVIVAGAPAPNDVVAVYAGQLGYVFGDEPGGDGVDLLGGFEPVADFEAFVVELTADDVEVEVDDDLAVVGLLADDVRQGAGLALFVVIGSCVLVYRVCQGAVFTTEGRRRAQRVRRLGKEGRG